MTTDHLIQRKQEIQTELSELSTQLKSFPPGNISCTKQGNHYKWFYSLDGKQTYIPKKERDYAEQLAFKKYLSLHKNDLQEELQAINAFLAKSTNNFKKADKLLSNPAYQELLSKHTNSTPLEVKKWAKDSFQSNPLYPEQLTHESISGNILRSKSERLIDMLLFQNNIPYRYECLLILQGKEYYPDFTIMHPETKKIYYWEHFGMMDMPHYCQKFTKKMQTYLAHGIVPSINLITTFETSDYPLSAADVEQKIKWYFK